MSEISFELTRRRALAGLLTIGAGSAAAGAGTFALFSDTETSSGNTVQAGTLDLTVNSGNGFSMSLGGTELAPGDDAGSASATLNNAGNVAATLDLDVSLTENDAGTDPVSIDLDEAETAKAFEVTSLTYGTDGNGDPHSILDDVSESTSVSDLTGGSETGTYTSLEDLANANISGLDEPNGTDFGIALTFREEAGNDFQADGVDVTFTFTLNQNTD